ncbi:MAG: hypothetical protein JW904_09855 [Spirochaetales bacterium]|nr:hypothetical protein [Spirochaetales bacterium]
MKHLITSFVILVAILLIFSCTDGLTTIFENINNDVLIQDNALDNELNIMGIAQDATSYYIACGKLRTRLFGEASWSNVDTGSSGIHNTLVSNGTDVYAGVVDDTGIGTLRVLSGGTWSPAATPANFQQAGRMKYISGVYLMSYFKDDGTYSLAVNFTENATVNGLDLATPVTDMLPGPIFTVGNTVYNNGTDVTPNTAYTYTSLGYNPGGTGPAYFLGTTNGVVYYSTAAPSAPGDWTALPTQTFSLRGVTTNVRFGTFLQVEPDYMLVGTTNYGFFQIDAAALAIDHFNDASKYDLYYGGIEAIHKDTTNDTVFFGTMGSGLWYNTFVGGLWTGLWTRG